MIQLINIKFPDSFEAVKKSAANFEESNFILPKCYNINIDNTYDYSPFYTLESHFPKDQGDSFTLNFWVRFKDDLPSAFYIICYQGCYYNHGTSYYSVKYQVNNTGSDRLTFEFLYSNEDLSIDVNLKDNQWHNITVAHDAVNKQTRLVINDSPSLRAELNYTQENVGTSVFYPLIIGGCLRERGGSYLKAKCVLSAFSLFKSFLSNQDISQMYNAGTALSYLEYTATALHDAANSKQLVSYWELSEHEEEGEGFKLRSDFFSTDTKPPITLEKSLAGTNYLDTEYANIIFKTQNPAKLLTSEGAINQPKDNIEFGTEIVKIKSFSTSISFNQVRRATSAEYDRSEKGLDLVEKIWINSKVYPQFVSDKISLDLRGMNNLEISFSSILKSCLSISPYFIMKNRNISITITCNTKLRRIDVTANKRGKITLGHLDMYKFPCERQVKITISNKSISGASFQTRFQKIIPNLLSELKSDRIELVISGHQVLKTLELSAR